uniref:hypothetical protein n=1 Tax=Enterobacter cloacae complex sp. TaxID=2027919 RepID=UPI002100CA07|nr:hypothetical protein [Enterobacter cloacae complex sp.]
MLQQVPYNLINTSFTQRKPWVTGSEASADLIRVIEEKLNKPCTLFEIMFSYQARSQPAQNMFEPKPVILPSLLIFDSSCSDSCDSFSGRAASTKVDRKLRRQYILRSRKSKIISPVRHAAESLTGRLVMAKILTDRLKEIQMFIIIPVDPRYPVCERQE